MAQARPGRPPPARYAGTVSALAPFSPTVRRWFEQTFDAPTPAQERGWPAIASGKHTLIQAPTGSGKTLAAFLWALDRARPGEGIQVLYVSPLKALNYDVERNLRGPLAGIGSSLTVGVRTGDTPAKERAAMLRNPPDILITTPESLFLLLTSRARETLRTIRFVIVDEVHAVAGTKRGAHLALSLERLERLTAEPVQRIGLSATQRPLDEIGRFVSGGREIELVDAGRSKELDLRVVVPVEDMREPGEGNSIWPSIYPELLQLVESHRSTIVFVNNRRLAERLALRLNELAEREIARAHHGSLAREQRVEVEELLKRGEIPALVATSSLELGIDMGAVDLVIQVESPKSVARGLQRVGRAGHRLDEPSKGRIFPKFRADLLESAVVAERMREGAIEETRVPRNPLDVLAQQIVAITADEEISVDELHELVRRAYPFRDLSRKQLENVLDMLAGRYPSEEFAELRPRIVWDRVRGFVRGREGARRLAVTNAGTIPDRGLFGVYLVEGGGRVGELDEEMVYEARAGQTFLLGASTWRIEEITRDRVLVSPAPGIPGLVPFWKGEGVGRPFELGQAIGRTARELVGLDDKRAIERLTDQHSLDERAAQNLLTYLREQEEATRAIPSDRTVVVERFRDEIGDWRLCILTPFGGRVHAPWSLALAARLRESLGLEVNAIWSDDGIALHLPDADAPPPIDDVLIDPAELEELVVTELAGTALFGARFRENAARALLIPRRRPGQRTPLWQQRLKAQGLLQVARRYSDFPVILETYRECLQDVFDLPALRELLAALRQRRIDLVEVETPTASPVRLVPPLRLRRHVHVRGRHAARRAPCPGPLARPRPAEGAARPGGASRSDRSGRARAGGGGAPRLAEEPGPAARSPAPQRRSPSRRIRSRARRAARGRAPGGADPRGRRDPADRGRGRRPLPGRRRRDAAVWSARRLPRIRRRPARRAPRPLRAWPRAVHDRGGSRPLRHRVRASRSRARPPRARWTSGPRRASARWVRARVVRAGRSPPPSPREPRRAAQGGRAGGRGGPRPVPARLARDRSAGNAERGARAAAGGVASRLALGDRHPPAPRARLPAGRARPADRLRRGRVGRGRARAGGRLLP